MEKALAESPDNVSAREKLVTTYIVDLDRPSEAAKRLSPGLDPVLRANAALAAKEPSELGDADRVALGLWYRSLAARTPLKHTKVSLLKRSSDYLRMYLEVYTKRDAQRLKVLAALKSVDAELKRLGYEPPVETGPRVLADFEGETFGAWKVEGKAFGSRPRHRRDKGRYPVTGFLGEQVATSYIGGDGPTGRLISPQFVITQPAINFLIAGGRGSGMTCINLIIDGKVVMTATGTNHNAMKPYSWDVSNLVGKTGHIEIVDSRTDSWGHIAIDHICLGTPPEGSTGRE